MVSVFVLLCFWERLCGSIRETVLRLVHLRPDDHQEEDSNPLASFFSNQKS